MTHAERFAAASGMHFAEFASEMRWTPAAGSTLTPRATRCVLGPELAEQVMDECGERTRIERTAQFCHDSTSPDFCGFERAAAIGSTITLDTGEAYVLAHVQTTSAARDLVTYTAIAIAQATRAAKHARPMP